MKTTELISALNALLEKNGDNDIQISVRDHYSVYGQVAELNIDTSGCIWSGVSTNRDTQITYLSAYLNNDHDGKKAKITFRK